MSKKDSTTESGTVTRRRKDVNAPDTATASIATASTPGTAKGKVYVLDTSVLIHDPMSIFSFEENDIFEPFQVLHELDRKKKGPDESARNAREASRLLRKIVSNGTLVDKRGRLIVEEGFPLTGPSDGLATGRLFFQNKHVKNIVSGLTNGHEGDDLILSAVKYAQEELFPDREVIFVTKDSNALVKAISLQIRAEDYKSDEIRVMEDSSLIRKGVFQVSEDFWDRNECDEIGKDLFKIRGDIHNHVFINEFVLSSPPMNHIPRMTSVVGIEDGAVILREVPDFSSRSFPRIFGIKPRNLEQNLALSMLMDPDIDLVTILGRAGSGKTILALASSLEQVMTMKRYSEVIWTRANIPMGRDSGFLPGTEKEKQMPLMGGLLDNLDVVLLEKIKNPSGKKSGTVASSETTSHDILNKVVSVKDMSLMRGRSFTGRIVVIDEFQNLTQKQAKSVITRIGEGSKVICLGNLAQIDTPYLSEASSGLTYLANRFASWPHSGHIILEKCTRSRLAYYAEEML